MASINPPSEGTAHGWCHPEAFRRRWRWFRALLKEPTTYPMTLLAVIALFLNADQNLVSFSDLRGAYFCYCVNLLVWCVPRA